MHRDITQGKFVMPQAPAKEEPNPNTKFQMGTEKISQNVEAPLPEASASVPAERPAAKIVKDKRVKEPGSLRAKAKDVSRHARITFYATEEEQEMALIAKAKLRKPVSDIARDAFMNYINSTYCCVACGVSFTINADAESAQKPSMCPCCGGNKMYQLNAR